jgi:hypothetical protein
MAVKTGIQKALNSWIPGRAAIASLPGMTIHFIATLVR